MRTIRLRTKPPRNGLQLEYLFAGNVTDTSGNANNGTATSVTYNTGRKGGTGLSAYFDGAAGNVTTPYTNSDANFTVCAHVKRIAKSAWEMMIIKSRGGYYEGWIMTPAFTITGISGNNVYIYYTSTLAEAWRFTAFKRAGSDYYLYEGNKLNNSANFTIVDSPIDIRLGGSVYWDYPTYSYKGYIDSLRYYNRALSLIEMKCVEIATK